MGLNLTGGALAGVTGGASLLPGASGAISGLLGGSKTTTQVPLQTPQQIAAQNALLAYGQTGTAPDGFVAGAEVPLGYGDFNTTTAEDQGLSSLQSLLSSGIPSQYKLGDTALANILNPKTAADGVQAQFQPFAAQTQRTIDASQAALKRSAGFAGSLYSTGTVKNLGDIQAQGNNTLTAQLASLTNDALNRQEQAIPLAYQSAQDQQNATLANINASQQYGDLTRSLNSASIQARDTELLRRRSELQQPIQALESVAGDSAQFGVPSVTTSPYQQLLGLAGTVGGTALGTYLGGPAGGAVGGKVGGAIGNSAGGSSPSLYAATA